MDTAQHYSVSGLVYHPLQPHPQTISDPVPHHSFPQDMSWHHPPPNPAPSGHPQMSAMMPHPQDRVEYVHPSVRQSFIPRHPSESFSNRPPSPSVDPGPSMSFESPQIGSSIGPDRGLSRRRPRLLDRVHSHAELPEYPVMSQSYAHPPNSQYPQQGSRPQSPSTQAIYQMPDQPPLNPDAYDQRLENVARLPEWRGFFPPAQSRSASGSAASASSNPRSASPALSVASAFTSVSSSASAPTSQVGGAGFPTSESQMSGTSLSGRKEPSKKRRLFNVDRYQICVYAQDNPGVKQEDIANKYGVERSTVSKILKQKHRWLQVSPDEKVMVAKLRPSKFPSLERRLEDWVKLASKQGKTLTDSVLRQKAREFGDEMGYTADKFKASSGWLENFKHRHGIRRGVWHGNGTIDQKYRAYASDFMPPVLEPMVPGGLFTDENTPPPMHGQSHGDHDMGLESEDEDGQCGGMQVMHPSLALQPAWPQSLDQTASHGETSPADAYYSPEQRQQSQQHDSVAQPEPEPPAIEAIMPPAEPIPIALNADDGSEQQVYVVPVMPEVFPEPQVPDFAEAERSLDKVILYIQANKEDMDIDVDDLNLLIGIKYKFFGQVTGRKYEQPFMPSRNRTES